MASASKRNLTRAEWDELDTHTATPLVWPMFFLLPADITCSLRC
jgi:hypothetical protein